MSLKKAIAIYLIPLLIYSTEPVEKTKQKSKSLKFLAEIYLCDNRTFKGKIELAAPERIVIIHEINGLEFSKEINLNEIKSITFNSWLPELIEIKKDKGKVYKFSVSNYNIEMMDSLELKVKKPLPEFLEKFTLSNKYGIVNLYTYWIDLLKKDNTWYTGLNGPENGERTFCFKDVVKKIIFKNSDYQDK